MNLVHKQKRMKEARKIYAESGANGLLEYLCSFSYGSSDKFCNRALCDIDEFARRKKRATELWPLVSKFIDHWDMTFPER